MKTRGAISLVATAESTAQKYTFSTRNIKVVIENSLSKHLLSFNQNSERASEREREREREISNLAD